MPFGNDVRGQTVDDFGKTAQYGSPNLSWFLRRRQQRAVAQPLRRQLSAVTATCGASRRWLLRTRAHAVTMAP